MGACQCLTSSRRTTQKLLPQPVKQVGLGCWEDAAGLGAPWMPCFGRVSFSVPGLASLRMTRGFHDIHSRLSSLGWRTWKTKAASRGAEQVLGGPTSCYSEGEPGLRRGGVRLPFTLWAANILHHPLKPCTSEKKLHALEIPILLYSSLDLAWQAHRLRE